MPGHESDRPTTVLLVHPSAELYGSDRVALESAWAFAQAGWTVHVALASDGPLRDAMARTGSPTSVVPGPVLRKSSLTLRGALRLAVDLVRHVGPMWRLLRRTGPDVVYVSTVTIPWWIVLARLAGARVVCHVHEAEEAVPRGVRVGLAAPLLLTHRVLANSRRSRDILARDLRRLADRIDVVDNGVPGPADPAPPRPQLTGPIRLVLVGRVSPRKGTDVAVRALARLVERGTDAHLDLVGGVFPGYEWFETQVREIAAEEGVTDRLRWRGVLPEVWAALAEADIALVPSRVEPFGNAAVEAMLAERPVVAGDTQGLREIVRPGVNGELVVPGDADDLAGTVEDVVRNWPESRARAAAARTEADARFAPARYRTEVVSRVTGLLDGGNDRPRQGEAQSGQCGRMSPNSEQRTRNE